VDDFSTGRHANLAHLDVGAIKILDHDVRSKNAAQLMASFEPDEVYHLACPASPPAYQRDPQRTLETCFFGTRAALDAAEHCSAKILIASTSEIYGDPPAHQHPQREEFWGHVNPRGERSCYDEGKRAAEALSWCYEQRRVCVQVARIFNTYGPRMAPDDGRVVSNFVCQALLGQALTIYGDGSQTRSLCYVTDTVDGLVKLMSMPAPVGPVNLGNPTETTMLDLARAVATALDGELAIDYLPLPADDPKRRRPDIGRAGRLLGWRPTTPLAVGLTRTVAYFREEMRKS
jgi:UDP-glucuronate decarboxylase